MKKLVKKLILEKELSDMYLNVDSLIDMNNIITGSNNITLRKVNVQPYGCDKMYMVKI